MADIDLKTETPDTSLPSTGFLFGADSQSAASPSVYSTQAVATALLGSTSLTGATVTADSPVLNLAQTWNNSGVTFTGLKFNVPTDTSAAGSLLMDLQVGGSSRFYVGKTGNLKLGVSPTGTNQAGTNVIIAGSQGTGTGAGGSIVFQVAPAGSSGTAQNALATAFQVNGNGGVTGQDGATANTLALRNGANAQTFRVYNTWTSFGSGTEIWERGKFAWESSVLTIGTEKGANGGTARTMVLQTDGTTRVTLNNSAVIEFSYSQFNLGGGARIHAISNGVLGISNSSNADGSFVFGASASNTKSRLTPSGTTLQVRLGDDSAFATIQGKLRADVNAVAETPTATHTITITDASGTAYKVLCVAA